MTHKRLSYSEKMAEWERQQDEKNKWDWQSKLSDALYSHDLQEVNSLLEEGIIEGYISSSDANLNFSDLMDKYCD